MAIPDGTTLADLTPQVSVSDRRGQRPTAEIAWYYLGANQDVCVQAGSLSLPLIQTAAVSDADSSLDVKTKPGRAQKVHPPGAPLKIILNIVLVGSGDPLAFASQASCSSTQKRTGKTAPQKSADAGAGTCAGSAGRSTPWQTWMMTHTREEDPFFQFIIWAPVGCLR